MYLFSKLLKFSSSTTTATTTIKSLKAMRISYSKHILKRPFSLRSTSRECYIMDHGRIELVLCACVIETIIFDTKTLQIMESLILF